MSSFKAFKAERTVCQNGTRSSNQSRFATTRREKLPDVDRVHANEKGSKPSNCTNDEHVSTYKGSGVVRILSIATMAKI
jgi:hypothetical protein